LSMYNEGLLMGRTEPLVSVRRSGDWEAVFNISSGMR
jgi:hypothetical protein